MHNSDKFDKHIASKMALGVTLEPTIFPKIFISKTESKRAKYIQEQYARFLEQAIKFFKDKVLEA